jgi:hypothetical protein
MPRDLADVLHHLIPESTPEVEPLRPAAPRPAVVSGPAALPVVGVPVGDRDVVRAALVWNLAVEIGRLGASAAVVAPEADRASALWPEESSSHLGADVVLVPAMTLGELARAARELATERAHQVKEGGLVFVRIPPLWLRDVSRGSDLLRWTLLFTSSESRDLLESYGIAKLVSQAEPGARLGITVHGARHQGEAEKAFTQLAEVVARRLQCGLTSYGLLVDDLHVYRAIVAQRPIGMVHPQSPAARSMREVARLVLDDAGGPTDG